jgi:ABC-type uncharacterized transport system permease subunit
MTFEAQLFYVWLVIASVFVVWRILTSPVGQIHNAVINGNLEIVRSCLDKGVNADIRQNNGLTPLCLAASFLADQIHLIAQLESNSWRDL